MSAQLLSGFGASHSERIRPYATIDLAGIRVMVDPAPVTEAIAATRSDLGWSKSMFTANQSSANLLSQFVSNSSTN